MARIIGRLRRRADFVRAAQRGRKAVFPGLIVQAVAYRPDKRRRRRRVADPASAPPSATPSAPPCSGNACSGNEWIRVGFTASRAVGGAVARNRARRRLRSVVSDVMPGHGRGGYDYVIIARRVTRSRAYGDLQRDLILGLKQLSRSV